MQVLETIAMEVVGEEEEGVEVVREVMAEGVAILIDIAQSLGVPMSALVELSQ